MTDEPTMQPGEVGPADPIDRAWQAKADELELNSLTNVRSVAEKWSTGLAALLGLLGLGAVFEGVDLFKDLAADEEDAAKVLFAAAFVCGFIATALALRATMGTIGVLARPGSGSLRNYSRREVDKALASLQISRVFAGVAIVAVGLSAGILMFGAREEPSDEPTSISIRECEGLAAGGLQNDEDDEADFVVRCD